MAAVREARESSSSSRLAESLLAVVAGKSETNIEW